MLKSELIRGRRLEVLGGEDGCARTLWRSSDGWVCNGHVAVRPSMLRDVAEAELEVRGPTVESVLGQKLSDTYGRLAEVTGVAHWTPPTLETATRRRWRSNTADVLVKLTACDRPFTSHWLRAVYLDLLWPWASERGASWRVGGGELSPVLLLAPTRVTAAAGYKTREYQQVLAVLAACRGPE